VKFGQFPFDNFSREDDFDMAEPATPSFWRRHRPALLLASGLAWVALIVIVYTGTRTGESYARSVNVLKIGALPVT